MEQWVENRTVYEGRVFNVRTGYARISDGSLQPREVVDHAGGVAIVPVHDGRVILVRQYRIAVGCDVLELPAGRLEAGDTPESRARLELEEETGYRAGRLVHVTSCYCSPGFTNEMDHIFLGLDLEKSAARPEFDEELEIVEVPLDEAWRILDSSELVDGKTIIGLYALRAYLNSNR